MCVFLVCYDDMLIWNVGCFCYMVVLNYMLFDVCVVLRIVVVFLLVLVCMSIWFSMMWFSMLQLVVCRLFVICVVCV